MKNYFILMVGLFAAIFSNTNVYSEVLYRQTFGNNTGADTTFAALGIDWYTVRASDGFDRAARQVVSGNGGYPQNLPDVNTGGTTLSQTNGVWFLGEDCAVYTTEYSFNTADYTNIQFSWYQANQSSLSTYQVIVRVGGNWYISNQTFNNPDGASLGNLSNYPRTFDYANTAANWKTLTLNIGSPVTIGSTPTSDLSGIMDGFGLYSDWDTGNSRMDTFTITATTIPEPSTWALIGFGVFSLGCISMFRKWKLA